eukprot:GEZU01022771.1.p1 GENE.GEZU01022771.1~~GEZU01022771.1.p1  ORF type:complete len:166 (-),score=15.52 GEZU01022771.1:425-922(-)
MRDHYFKCGVITAQIVFTSRWVWLRFFKKPYNDNNNVQHPFDLLLIDLIGFAITAAGFWLRIWSFQTLGKFFTFTIGIREGHQLVKTGPYRYLIHPSYSGTLWIYLGFAIFTRVWWWLTALGAVILLALLSLRMTDEERMLRDHFGDRQWQQYASARKRLIPFIY